MARDFEPDRPGGAMVCQTCGSVVADGWFAEHRAFHQPTSPTRAQSRMLVGMSDKAVNLEMTICEAEIDGVSVVIVPEKAQRMLRALGWTPPSEQV
jgi:hypothetical protein